MPNEAIWHDADIAASFNVLTLRLAICALRLGMGMLRRDFLSVVGGAAVPWPLTALRQPLVERRLRIIRAWM